MKDGMHFDVRVKGSLYKNLAVVAVGLTNTSDSRADFDNAGNGLVRRKR